VNSRGYTFIEILIVFSILAVISSVTFIQLNPNKNMLDHQIFLTQLQSDLYYAQQVAIAQQQEVTVVFDNQAKRYYTRLKFDSSSFIERKFPSNVSMKYGSMPLNFRILHDGNVSQFGSFFIYMDGKEYRLTFLLGKGRFYIA
jgi:competence protein ComGD